MSQHPQTHLAAVLGLGIGLVLGGEPAASQSFDDGSFGDDANAGSESPPLSTGTGGGGSESAEGSFGDGSFGDGSFAEGGSGGSESGSDGGGFGESSFEDGGVSGNVDSGGVVLEETPGGDDFGPDIDTVDDNSEKSVIDTSGDTDTATDQKQQEPTDQIYVDPQILAFETRDFGVPPQDQLRSGQFHAPTPTALPGGYVVSTQDLAQAMNDGTPMVVIDVLGGTYGLPDAFTAPTLSTPGSFKDRVQQQANSWLGQITGGDSSVPIVIYCSDPMCWMSYNGALRAIASGYQNVYWYRGGLQAWQMAGLPMYPTGF